MVINIYREAAGQEFDSLPSIVRWAHEPPLRAKGVADVRQGNGFGKVLARLFGMPHAGNGIELSVQVDKRGDDLAWHRRFGAQAFDTLHRLKDGRVLEKAGPATLELRIWCDAQILHYLSERVWLFGVSLPALLRPVVAATVREEGEGWRVAVSVTHPAAGLLCAYQGRLIPQ